VAWEGEYMRPLFRRIFASEWSGIHERIQANRKDMIGKGDSSILAFNQRSTPRRFNRYSVSLTSYLRNTQSFIFSGALSDAHTIEPA
jgi:hypothetical protein